MHALLNTEYKICGQVVLSTIGIMYQLLTSNMQQVCHGNGSCPKTGARTHVD